MERDERKIHEIQKAIIDRSHEQVRLEVMWDPSIADPEIHLTDEELDEFISSFSINDRGQQLKLWIETGLRCEERKEIEGRMYQCRKSAVASIDWTGVTHGDSIFVCREDIRPVYRNVMTEAVAKQGISPNVTINGKEVPKPQK